MGRDQNSVLVTPKLELFPVQPNSPDSCVTALSNVDLAETIRTLGPGPGDGRQSQARGLCMNRRARSQGMLTQVFFPCPSGGTESGCRACGWPSVNSSISPSSVGLSMERPAQEQTRPTLRVTSAKVRSSTSTGSRYAHRSPSSA